jgi:diguanylate cyclase (GGDEF)-like protein
MRALKITTTLRGMTAILLVAPLAATSFVFFHLDAVDRSAQSLGTRTLESVLLFDACVRASLRGEASLSEVVLTQDRSSDAKALGVVEEQLAVADHAWETFAAANMGRVELEVAQRWWALREQVADRGLRPAIAAMRDGNVERARGLILTEVMARRDASTIAADLFLEQQHATATAVLRELRGGIHRVKWVAAMAPFLMLCMGVLALFVSRSIERPLSSMVSVAEALGLGDKTARVKIESDNELATLGRAINQMADGIADANCRLEALATTDGLTGLLNRRCFDERSRNEWSRACRTGQRLSLLMIDVDHFKAYNDRYGHPAGDAALAAVAAALHDTATRAGELCARYGGEEFVALLPAADSSAALVVAERFRAKLAALAIPHAASATRSTLSVSIGVATMVPAVGTDPKLLLDAADAALYEAKRAGRDRVHVSGSNAFATKS